MAGAATPPLLRIGVLALLVLQNTSLRLVMKHARTVSPNFSATAAVFGVRGPQIYNSDRRARAREAVPYDGIGRGFELSRTTTDARPGGSIYLLTCRRDRLHQGFDHSIVRPSVPRTGLLDVAAFQVGHSPRC